MKVQKFTDEYPGERNKKWLQARLGKMTGTRPVDNIVILKADISKALEESKIIFKKTDSKEELEALLPPDAMRKLRNEAFASREKKIVFYELIAEKLSVSEEDMDGYVPNETPMDRGTRMEKFAIDRFEKETSKKVDATKALWMREDDEDIAISPDGVISETEAIETKCKSSALHVKAYLTKEIPSEYEMQVLQYFIVNDKLLTLNFVFYDTRLPAIAYFVIEVTRQSIGEEKIAEYLEYQKKTLAEVREVVNSITF